MKLVQASTKKEVWIRMGLGVLFACLLVVSLLPLLSFVRNIGVVVSAGGSVLGLLGCVWWPALRDILMGMWKRRRWRIVLLILAALIAALLVLFIVVSVLMVSATAQKAPENATVIVLGAAAYGDRPSPMLADRLDAAARYLEENPASACVVSGGQGPDETQSEASVMKAYLIEKGIAEERIFEEDTSTSTFENIRNSRRIIEEQGLSDTLVVATQEFHQYRAQAFGRRAGAADIGPCSCRTPPHLFICYWIREFAAVCRMWILGY